jgi:hypothetical protein
MFRGAKIMSIEIKDGKWHGVAKQRKELGIDGWEVIIFHESAIAYREFHCKVYPEEEVRQAMLNYIKERKE